MTDGTPGWYLDRDDPTLARWHDGTEWSEHTLVIADQEPGSDPPPPPATRRISDAALQRERNLAMQEKKAAREAARLANGGSSYGRWMPAAALIVVALLGVGAFVVLGGDDDSTTKVDTDEALSIDESVDVAREAGFPDEIGDARASGLVEDLCEAAKRPTKTAALRAELDRLNLEPVEHRRAVRALGEGAEAYCPEEKAGIVTAVRALEGELPATETTLPSVDGGVVDGSVTTIVDPNPPTTTVKKSPTKATTATTVATTTTTTIPPTTTTTLAKLTVGEMNGPCSTAGEKRQFAGSTYTCQSACNGGSGLVWRNTSCPPPVGPSPTN